MTAPGDDDGELEGLPLYLQVSTTLRTAILRGVYAVGTRLPTEEELCRRFAVSRHTIREALRQLRADGLISARPGSRPVVVPPARPRPAERIADDIGKDFFDYTIGTRLEIASMDMVPIAADLATQTGLPAGETCLRVEGYRTSVDTGRTTCWNSYLIDARYARLGRLLARHVGPIIPLLEDLFGQHIARIARSVSAVPLTDDHAERFEMAAGTTTLAVMTRCETANGRTAMVNRSLHPGATLDYTIKR